MPLTLAVLIACSPAPDPVAPTEGRDDVQALLASASAAGERYDALVDDEGMDLREAIGALATWLEGQPGVLGVRTLDDTYVFWTLPSGLETGFWLDEVDADGQSLFRGAPGGGALSIEVSEACERDIAKDRILFFNAEPSFATQQDTLDLVPERFEVDSCTGSACDFDRIGTFGEYGLVVLNTHGLPNGFMTGLAWEGDPTDAVNWVTDIVTEERLRGKTSFVMTQTKRKTVENRPVPVKEDANRLVAYATSTFVEQLPRMSETVVFGNHCYSGQTSTINLPEGEDTPIATAWTSRDPIAYYGYQLQTGQSLPVTSKWCFERETALVGALIDGDATEEAHLDAAGNEYVGGITELERRRYGEMFFRHRGPPGYCFDPCIDTFVDVRDDHVYGCRCFGDQIWMTENLVYAGPGVVSAPTDPTGERLGFFYDLWTLLDGAAGSNVDPSGVQGLCPAGWHVPSDVEWQRLELHVGVEPDEITDGTGSRGVVAQSGRALKAEGGWTTADGLDAFGFGALGTGFVLLDGSPPYIGEGALTAFATTTTLYDEDAERWQASYRILYDDDPGIWFGTFDIFESDDVTPDRNFKVSARCVKDPEAEVP